MSGDRVIWGRIVAVFIRRGWRPPPLRDDQAARLFDDMKTTHRASTLRLTERELVVLTRLAYGDSAPQIAPYIGRAEETVKSYRSSILNKLGARNTPNAVAIAIDDGLIESDTGWREAA